MERLVGLFYFLAAVVALAALMTLTSCQSLHDDRWDIGPTKTKKVEALLPPTLPRNEYGLTPAEYQAIEAEYPTAFLPALQG